MGNIYKHNILTTIAVGLALAVVAASGSRAQTDEPSLKAPAAKFDAKAALAMIYAGRSDSALAMVELEIRANPYDPLVLLIKARAMRDELADEDIDKGPVSEDNKPIHAVLDRVIELCDDALKLEASDPIYHYYKGRAHLAKAQLHILAREMWSAGGTSRSAKSHLEKYLELRPDDPDVHGDLGAFLYFADTIPGVVKFFSKLLMLPSGDRERGLRMLEYASTHDGLFETDHRVTIAAINLLFEGRFRDGTDQMLRLIEQYPYYTRLMEPVAVLAPLDPLRIDELSVAYESAIERHRNSELVRYDDSLVKRMTAHALQTRLFFGSPAAAMPQIDVLLANFPPRPDWTEPLMQLNRAVFLAMDGRVDAARQDQESVLAQNRFKHFHDIAKQLLNLNDRDTGRRALADMAWIDDIYRGSTTKAAEGLKSYETTYGRDRVYLFYAGELALMNQDFERARREYEACLNVSGESIDEYYQFWACLRVAEIHGHQFRYKQARDYYQRASGYKRVTYLLDFLMTSRIRYYSLLEEGAIDAPPRLLYYHTYEGGSFSNDSPSDARN